MADEKAREHVPVRHHPTTAHMNALTEGFALLRAADTGLGQRRAPRVHIDDFSAGACSLAGEHRHERTWGAACDTEPEGALKRSVRDLLGLDHRALTEDTVGKIAMQALTVLGQPALRIGQVDDRLIGALGARPPPIAAALPVSAPLVVATGGTGAVLAIQPPLEPTDLALLVGQLGPEGLLERAMVADHNNLGRPDIQADKLTAGLVALEWNPVKDKLGTEGPPALDASPGDPATQQPTGRDV